MEAVFSLSLSLSSCTIIMLKNFFFSLFLVVHFVCALQIRRKERFFLEGHCKVFLIWWLCDRIWEKRREKKDICLLLNMYFARPPPPPAGTGWYCVIYAPAYSVFCNDFWRRFLFETLHVLNNIIQVCFIVPFMMEIELPFLFFHNGKLTQLFSVSEKKWKYLACVRSLD